MRIRPPMARGLAWLILILGLLMTLQQPTMLGARSGFQGDWTLIRMGAAAFGIASVALALAVRSLGADFKHARRIAWLAILLPITIVAACLFAWVFAQLRPPVAALASSASGKQRPFSSTASGVSSFSSRPTPDAPPNLSQANSQALRQVSPPKRPAAWSSRDLASRDSPAP